MSMIEVGIDSGFVEMDEGLLIIYPKRVMNTAMLHQTIEEAINEGFCPQSEVTYNKPIIMKKSNTIDMTEVVVKLFASSLPCPDTTVVFIIIFFIEDGSELYILLLT